MIYFLIRAVKKIWHIARDLVTRAMLHIQRNPCILIKKLIEPKSTTEDDRRREYILNIILLISISTLILLGLTIVWNITHIEKYTGINPWIFTTIVIAYVGLLYISKKGLRKTSTTLLIILNAIGTIYTGWHWGASLPETLLLTVLTIEIAGVLISPTTGFITAGIMISILTILGIHESIYLNVPDWRYYEISVTDVITYSVMFLFVSFIAWLSKKEIDSSLARARYSETLLETERNILEQRVSERTEELIINQQKNLVEVEHTIRIGELARGVIHDMMNPLSSIALYIEDINNNPEKYNNSEARILFEKTLNISRRMTDFMESTRHFISNIHPHSGLYTDLRKEINIACDVVAYKARKTNVYIDTITSVPIILRAHPTRVHQILINILFNAIDSFTDTVHNDRIIKIETEKSNGFAIVVVFDNGCGMDISDTEKIFSNPKTIKVNGCGIGLTNIYSIIKNELNGSIEVISNRGIGTKITITLPLSPSLSSDQE